jgi:hypothetical protein
VVVMLLLIGSDWNLLGDDRRSVRYMWNESRIMAILITISPPLLNRWDQASFYARVVAGRLDV